MRKRSFNRNQKGLATWLKWVIGIVVAFTVFSMTACGIVGYFAMTAVSDMTNPTAVKQKMSKIVEISDISSERYTPNIGMELAMLDVVISSITDTQTKLTWAMVKMPNNEKETQTNEQLLEQFAESGVPTATTTGQGTMKVGIKSKGTTKVGGMEMAYILGTTNSDQGIQPVYLGLTIPRPKQVVLICAIGEAGKEIDLNQVNEFLAKVKSFK